VRKSGPAMNYPGKVHLTLEIECQVRGGIRRLCSTLKAPSYAWMTAWIMVNANLPKPWYREEYRNLSTETGPKSYPDRPSALNIALIGAEQMLRSPRRLMAALSAERS